MIGKSIITFSRKMAVNFFTTTLALLAAFIFVANVMVFCTTKRKGLTWIFVIRLEFRNKINRIKAYSKLVNKIKNCDS